MMVIGSQQLLQELHHILSIIILSEKPLNQLAQVKDLSTILDSKLKYITNSVYHLHVFPNFVRLTE